MAHLLLKRAEWDRDIQGILFIKYHRLGWGDFKTFSHDNICRWHMAGTLEAA